MRYDRIQVEWEVDDGYSGGSRPQHASVYHSDLSGCDSEEEVRQLVREAIESDFEVTVSASYDEKTVYTKALELWREMKAEQATGT